MHASVRQNYTAPKPDNAVSLVSVGLLLICVAAIPLDIFAQMPRAAQCTAAPIELFSYEQIYT